MITTIGFGIVTNLFFNGGVLTFVTGTPTCEKPVIEIENSRVFDYQNVDACHRYKAGERLVFIKDDKSFL